jgi:hypothetical protein
MTVAYFRQQEDSTGLFKDSDMLSDSGALPQLETVSIISQDPDPAHPRFS